MCFNTTPAIPNSQKQIGTKNLGYMVMPRFGHGKMAGIPDSRPLSPRQSPCSAARQG